MYRSKSIALTAMSLDEERPIRPTPRMTAGQLPHHLSESALSFCPQDMDRRKQRELSLHTKEMLMLILLIGKRLPEPA